MILKQCLGTFNRFQSKLQLCARISYKCKSANSKVLNQDDDWVPIYKLPGIKWIAAFNRLKVYQLGATGLMVPVCFALQVAEQAPPNLGIISLALGLSGCFTLGFCSYFSTNFIGIIYMNKSKDLMKLAYVDYWGRRKHEEVPVSGIVPLSEIPRNKFDKLELYQRIKLVDSNTTYKLTLKYGQIFEPERFSSVFGE